MIGKTFASFDRFVLPETKPGLDRLVAALLHPDQDDEQVVNDALTEQLSSVRPAPIVVASYAELYDALDDYIDLKKTQNDCL